MASEAFKNDRSIKVTLSPAKGANVSEKKVLNHHTPHMSALSGLTPD